MECIHPEKNYFRVFKILYINMPFRSKFNLKDKCAIKKHLVYTLIFKRFWYITKYDYKDQENKLELGQLKNKLKVSTLVLMQIVGKRSLDYLGDEHLAFNISIANHTFTFYNVVNNWIFIGIHLNFQAGTTNVSCKQNISELRC